MARTCYLVDIDEEDERGEGFDLKMTHVSQITSGDLFCLEASHPFDPLHGLTVCERIYKAEADAIKVGGAWQIPATLL